MKKLQKKKLLKLYEFKLCKHFYINIFFFPVAVCSFFGGYSNLFFCAFAVALLHESAHILCALALDVSISRVTVFPFGVTARLSSGYIKKSEKEFFIAFAGPFLNLILFWITTITATFLKHPLFTFFADVNLAMCIVNLIPALPLDGGRMLKSILTAKFGVVSAYNFMMSLSRIVILLLGILAFILFFISGFNFSLILIVAFLLHNLNNEPFSMSHIAFKEIMENHCKMKDCKLFPAKAFCVTENAFASNILKHLSYDYYLTINIIDKNSKIVKTVTETQVISKLISDGIRIQYKDI